MLQRRPWTPCVGLSGPFGWPSSLISCRILRVSNACWKVSHMGSNLQPGWTQSGLETGPTGLGVISENGSFRLVGTRLGPVWSGLTSLTATPAPAWDLIRLVLTQSQRCGRWLKRYWHIVERLIGGKVVKVIEVVEYRCLRDIGRPSSPCHLIYVYFPHEAYHVEVASLSFLCVEWACLLWWKYLLDINSIFIHVYVIDLVRSVVNVHSSFRPAWRMATSTGMWRLKSWLGKGS